MKLNIILLILLLTASGLLAQEASPVPPPKPPADTAVQNVKRLSEVHMLKLQALEDKYRLLVWEICAEAGFLPMTECRVRPEAGVVTRTPEAAKPEMPKPADPPKAQPPKPK